MDWWKLFVLLVAVASVRVLAEGPKKKIRIHLPQKVKHIHHHKKIYITNHPAQSQYAPAFLPTSEGAVAVPTNVALPAVANIVPLSSDELYEESQKRLPGVVPAASKLLPLYRNRGYYGPNPSELDEEYDLAPPPEPAASYVPAAYSSPVVTGAASSNYPPKRVKIVNLKEITPRKKVVGKGKPKRVLVRGRPQPEEEHPVSPFHEQFYSDLEGSGTIRKIKKPQRIEKIIDGDTEHIHTYSEEHIHKVVFKDAPKLTGVVRVPGIHGVRALHGSDHLGSMSALAAAHPLIPVKNSQSLLAFPQDHFTGLTAVGSMGTPSHLEYAAYNPHDVTHDHIFHDHGEITADIDITKASLGFPPKVSYNSQGLRINDSGTKRPKPKPVKRPKPKKPSPSSDFSYYESMYSPHGKPKKVYRTTTPAPRYETSSEESIHDFEPIPSFKIKDKSKLKSRYITPTPFYDSDEKRLSDYRLQEASVPAPFALSSTVVHDYKPNKFAGSVQGSDFNNFKDPFDENDSNSFEYDTYASSSNVHSSQNKNEQDNRKKKGNKKSISTQNISFGRLEHVTEIDHQEQPSGTSVSGEDDTPSFDDFKATDSATSTPYTIKESSPSHQYYSKMAFKAMHNFDDQMSVPEASNDNFQYVEAPTTPTPTVTSTVSTTTLAPIRFITIQSTDAVAIQPTDDASDTRQNKRNRQKSRLVTISALKSESKPRYSVKPVQATTQDSDGFAVPHTLRHLGHRYAYEHPTVSSTVRGKLKYGDKI
ncbi:hypothetical protein MSG28_001067 [Choristoneura fumiferana]|uniref:Uncharacterized protein n=1 Tax=Choristoneura fumiferana TaxID=7141 RepID=A0ACC0K3M1_CHOFU|nr:hypothetical protein MSG28_001067 [Choristoneura fumiferana]